ncbi:MAG: TIGR03905 family TSCPD domain-containing protein [Lachnospiraceae bacterium]|nr:TIGR03905 family TSCPD domain-containing protein [Lachnospiraceae bacterium]
MSSYSYKPRGVCARQIDFDIEDGKIHNLKFWGGCAGNTAAISKLVEGADARNIAEILAGNDCGGRGTSCADQLSKGLMQALDDIQ